MDEWRDAKALIAAIGALMTSDPLECAEQARKLAKLAPAVLSRIGDRAVFDATRQFTHEAVADTLHVSPAAVNKAVVAHRRRMAA